VMVPATRWPVALPYRRHTLARVPSAKSWANIEAWQRPCRWPPRRTSSRST
jgi:hypothetical protein